MGLFSRFFWQPFGCVYLGLDDNDVNIWQVNNSFHEILWSATEWCSGLKGVPQSSPTFPLSEQLWTSIRQR